MAQHTKTFHTCDMCGLAIEKPYYGGESGTYTAEFGVEYTFGGHTIRWKELCVSCNGLLGKMIDEMVKRTKGLSRTTLAELEGGE